MHNPSHIEGIDPTAMSPYFETEHVRPDREPEVGIGGTIAVGSDRYPVTIVSIPRKGVAVVVVDKHEVIAEDRDLPRGTDRRYSFTPSDPEVTLAALENHPDRNRILRVYTKRSNGAWIERGAAMQHGLRLHVGWRDAYSDPSF
jgi:hypothetical protein